MKLHRDANDNCCTEKTQVLKHTGSSVIRTRAVVLATAAILVGLICGCGGESDTSGKLNKYMDQAVSAWQFSGAVLVAKGDSVLLRKGYGWADNENGRPLSPENKFLIGSMTKPFTSIAVHQLLGRGLLKLTDNIATYMPEYRPEVANIVTVHHLLSHQSGIPDFVNAPGFQERASETISVDELIAAFENLPLEFPPGERYTYSSSNFILLGAIIEAVTGETWEGYVQENICRRVGMPNTGIYPDYATRDDFAVGYSITPDGIWTRTRVIHPSCGYAAGGLASNVDDLFAFNLSLYGDELLPRTMIDQMLTAQTPFYGYGWLVDEMGGHKLTAHGGGTPGFVSMFQRWPDDSLCVIVLSNNVLTLAHTIATGLAAIAMNEEYQLPAVKTPQVLGEQALSQYVGIYRIDSADYRKIDLRSGSLFAERLNGFPMLMHPESKDKFYFDRDHSSTLEFIRDDSGYVCAHVLRQAFSHDTAWLATGDEANRLMYGGALAAADTTAMTNYVGRYKLVPAGFVLSITLADGELYGQAFDSAPIKLLPLSDSAFAFEGLSARIMFFTNSNGMTDSLRFSQDQQTMIGKRVQ